jgi:hypothetical protein
MQPGDPLHIAASADEERRRKPWARLLGPAELGPLAAALMDADNRGIWEVVPHEPPADWTIARRNPDDRGYIAVDRRGHDTGLCVHVNARWEPEVATDISRRRVHLMVSHEHKMPSYGDRKATKGLFLGPECQAFQSFPTGAHHTSIAPVALQLFSPVDVPALPDFTRGFDRR